MQTMTLERLKQVMPEIFAANENYGTVREHLEGEHLVLRNSKTLTSGRKYSTYPIYRVDLRTRQVTHVYNAENWKAALAWAKAKKAI